MFPRDAWHAYGLPYPYAYSAIHSISCSCSLAVLLAAASAVASAPSAIDFPQPLAYYRFEDASDPTVDSTGNGLRLETMSNTTAGAAFTAPGKNSSHSVGRYLRITPQGAGLPSVRDAAVARNTRWAAAAPVGGRGRLSLRSAWR